MKKKKKPLRRHSIRLISISALLWPIVSLIYSCLPQDARRPVYENIPRVDRMLRRTAFQLFSGWDELGIGGQDCVAPIQTNSTCRHAIGGLPSEPFRLRRLDNRGYAVGYSESLRNPLWAAYRIFDVPNLDSPPRPGFRRDPRSAAGVQPDDFTGSGYDRGHLAPNFAIATRYGPEAQQETFLMTNIMPQDPLINRYLWKNLEHRLAREYGRYFGEIWVTTGPIFTQPTERLPSGIAIPSAYYMILADLDNGQLRVMAFRVHKKVAPWTRIRSCLVSVDQLEEQTGLNFFPDLPEPTQTALEKEPATRLWPWLLPAMRYHLSGQPEPQ